jgi:hypothetical protein
MAEKTTEGSSKDTGNNSENRSTLSTGSKKVYIIKTQYVEKEAPNGPVQKAKRMLRGFGEGVGARGFHPLACQPFRQLHPFKHSNDT